MNHHMEFRKLKCLSQKKICNPALDDNGEKQLHTLRLFLKGEAVFNFVAWGFSTFPRPLGQDNRINMTHKEMRKEERGRQISQRIDLWICSLSTKSICNLLPILLGAMTD